MPSRPMFSMLARTPTAISTRSDVTVWSLPSASVKEVVTLLPLTFTPVVFAPVWRFIFRFLSTRVSDAEISSSSIGSSARHVLDTVTSTPNAFQKSANSTPIAPAPITTIDFGTSGSTIASR